MRSYHMLKLYNFIPHGHLHQNVQVHLFFEISSLDLIIYLIKLGNWTCEDRPPAGHGGFSEEAKCPTLDSVKGPCTLPKSTVMETENVLKT